MSLALHSVTAGWISTLDAMTIPVDYTDGTAVDPPAGTVFRTQADVDLFLANNSATNFKHLQAVWDALPPAVAHDVTFNMAAGIHRPQTTVTTIGWSLSDKKDFGGVITFAGDTTYDVTVASQAITGVQLDSDDPYVDVGGTPFAGLDLRGLYAILSPTGQKVLIHDHTDSRLYLIDPLSPDPTGGSVEVGEPSTKMRNSVDDVTNKATSSSIAFGYETSAGTNFIIRDILLDPFGGAGVVCAIYADSALQPQRFIIDQLSMIAGFGRTPNGNCWNVLGKLLPLAGTGFSIRAERPSADVDAAIYAALESTAQINSSYIAGARNGLFTLGTARITMNRAVFDTVGGSQEAAINLVAATMIVNTYSGKTSEIRNSPNAGILLDGSTWNALSTDKIRFVGNTDACVILRNGSTMDMRGSPNVLDGGGNLDVGIDVQGGHNTVALNATCDVTGAVADLRIDGITGSYASVGTLANPLVTTGLNIIGKG